MQRRFQTETGNHGVWGGGGGIKRDGHATNTPMSTWCHRVVDMENRQQAKGRRQGIENYEL